ncbi:unnamed protein product [Protopolystoma xenopodis]|uniref:Uncharacterized protein n=1 Tax=Protopolystoma xenopodis TaxID=117903 RepID=A0A3S5BUR5_9PLAT|nr:unnamed protein product [Protopolystoma xenopodis]
MMELVPVLLIGLLLPGQANLRDHIEQQFDLETTRSQLAETGHVQLAGYAERAIGLMQRFCAPARDEEVARLREIEDPVELFR